MNPAGATTHCRPDNAQVHCCPKSSVQSHPPNAGLCLNAVAPNRPLSRRSPAEQCASRWQAPCYNIKIDLDARLRLRAAPNAGLCLNAAAPIDPKLDLLPAFTHGTMRVTVAGSLLQH
eukprot:CAMPEP_0174378222 /NCGR_PEP_ID=MMETSP0811_2-20130205/121914_1 /TAXON_ID=73025 ORGANISM="Eutreptiella gymnastica-like, Strain CCMP1594" /NCGR_SAMPLE_ID=MMETSP0811_2 /ASSEMBLY_ACC=CAM_ASM_000667 /LENGTH=117 /DNA_ID=CAMNT_0015530379 /DNA_START=1046 /DNA_END=1400 /DNA_ORIENTATION=-